MSKQTKRCSYGHFYDAEKYAECPFCQKMNGEQASMQTAELDENNANSRLGSNGIFGQGKETDETVNNKIGFDKIRTDDARDMQKTVSFYSEMDSKNIELTVGVLLCVKGPNFGQTFLLKAGKNFIGRDSSMDVVISDDHSVSRYRHAIIVYEPKQRMFIGQPGESSELLYVNDKVVLDPLQLHEYDEISIGKTTLLFVPICGNQFSWEECMEN